MDDSDASRRPPAARAHVFINYRGADAGWAVHLDTVLSARFGPDRVFRASRSIRPGEDFVDRILSTVESASVLVVIIGPGWAEAPGATGERKIGDENDWVRREIAHAIRRRIPVLPVLIDNTPPLREPDLPPDIAQLARCQYLRVNYRAAQTDVRRVGDELARLVPELQAPATRRARRRRLYTAISLIVALVLVAASASWITQHRTTAPNPTSVGASGSQRQPWIAVTPARAGPGEAVRVKGGGFPARRRVVLTISTDGRWIPFSSAETNECGEFVVVVGAEDHEPLAEGPHLNSPNVEDDPRFHATMTYTVTPPR